MGLSFRKRVKLSVGNRTQKRLRVKLQVSRIQALVSSSYDRNMTGTRECSRRSGRSTSAGAMQMNAKVEQKERSHESILQSASRLVREKGISGAAVADVMKGAALTVGGFYAHFSSKDELVDETLRRTGSALRERLFERLDAKSEAERAESVLKRYLSAEHRDGGVPECPFPAVMGEVGTTAPQHRPVIGEQVTSLVDGLAQRLPATAIVPRRTLAIGLVALMYGGLSLARALKGSELSDEVLRACRALGAAAARGGKGERS